LESHIIEGMGTKRHATEADAAARVEDAPRDEHRAKVRAAVTKIKRRDAELLRRLAR